MQSAQFQLHATRRGFALVVRRPPADHAGPGPAGPLRERVARWSSTSGAARVPISRHWPAITTAWASTHRPRRSSWPGAGSRAGDSSAGKGPPILRTAMQEARLVLLMDVLEHVPDDFAFLSGLLAASAPGTDFLVTVPANPSFWSAHDESNGHYRRYDINRFQRLMGGAAGDDAAPVALQRAVVSRSPLWCGSWSRWRGRATGRAGTDVSLPIRPINAALREIFAGESRVLVDLLRRRRSSGAIRRAEPGRPAPP